MNKRFNQTDFYTRLARLAFRVTHPASMRHVAHSLPHLRLKRDGTKWRIYWRRQLMGTSLDWAPLLTATPDHLFVIGSGPSVGEQQLARIGDRPSLVVNGAASLINIGVLQNPIGVVIEDARFVRQRPDFIAALPRSTPIFATQNVLQALGAMNSAWLAEFPIYFMQGFTERYWQARQPLEKFDPKTYASHAGANISLDLREGIFGCGTVMYSAAQVALMHRPAHISLVGLDLTNFDQPRFYEQSNDQAWTGIQNAYQKRILPALTLLRQVCDERNIVIDNCSHTSIVPRDILPFNDELMGVRGSR